MLKLATTALISSLITSPVLGIDITTAYQDTAPKFMLNERGEASGICVDIFTALEAQDSQLHFSRPKYFTPLRRIFYAIENNALMAYCGAGYNTGRAKIMQYSKVPLYSVSTLLVASKKNTQSYLTIDDLKADSSLGFNAINDTSTFKLLEKLGLNIPGHYIKTVEQGLAITLRDKNSLFAYHSLGLKYALTHNKSWSGLKILPVSLRNYDHWMVFNKAMNKHELDAVNAALKKLRDQKVIKRILLKYQ